jgi:hypothetical protein
MFSNKESGVTRYVKLMMNSRFPVSNLMNSKDFLKFLSLRGFSTTEKELEYYDKLGLLRPALRLRRPKLNETKYPHSKYKYVGTDIFALQYYNTIGLIEFPADGDFQPWPKYIQDDEDTWLFYHPYQILQIDHIPSDINYPLRTHKIEMLSNTQNLVDICDRVNQSIIQTKKSQLLNWIPRVGLLILLDDYYGRGVKKNIPLNPFDLVPATEKQLNLRNWAKTFSPFHILMLCGMKIEQLEEFYTNLSLPARKIDPISEWFLLQRLIKKSRRYDLKNKALLAQEYYGYLFMVGQFIWDISHKKMPEPDDVCRSDSGKWKERIYGEPFDYDTKKTQNQILKYFPVDRPIELVIVVEGETEEKVIELILEARGVDHERDGFFVYNIQGQDNLLHLKPLFRVSQLIDITIFGMVDNDRNVNNKIQKMRQYARDLGYEKDIRIHIWDRDFETDNFGIDKVVSKVNQLLSEKGYSKINPLEIESRMKSTGDALIKSVEKEIWRVNVTTGIKSGKIISKPRLAQLLIEDRLKEIQIENEPHWIVKLPVEIELKKMFELIPSFM